MKWPTFALVLYLLLALQVSVASAMRMEVWGVVIEPVFLLVLLVFVGLSGSSHVVLIAAGLMGLFFDAITTWNTSSGTAMTLLGPHALGYMAAGLVLLQVRPMVFRQHPLAYAVMIVVAGFAVHLVVLGVFAVRIWYDPVPDFSLTRDLFARMVALGYSAVVGAVLSVPLVAASPMFGFGAVKGRRR